MTFQHFVQANALNIPLADCSVQMCVTSPPYWGLRSYGIGTENGELGLEMTPDCGAWSHAKTEQYIDYDEDGEAYIASRYIGEEYPLCGKCYVCNMVAVFREVRRVLKDDGVLWLNLGDSYAGSNCGSNDYRDSGASISRNNNKYKGQKPGMPDGLKPKDLVGIPWRVAFALQADGWWLRSDIIWDKPNPMPESVTDRPTKAHEYIFLLTKSARYYYDHEAIKEESNPESSEIYLRGVSDHHKNLNVPGQTTHSLHKARAHGDGYEVPEKRNKRTVWHVATSPYKGAHYATYPPKLIEPCILAGTSEKGHCPKCGALWERIVERERTFESGSGKSGNLPEGKNGKYLQGGGETIDIRRGPVVHATTIGWKPTCDCGAEPVPDIVLDPFNGSGTTGLVARKHGRNYIGTDLSLEYIHQAEERLSHTALKNWQHGKAVETTDLGPLFEVTA